MAKGRVKDPEGHQAQCGWGYIQRIDSTSEDETGKCKSVNWADDLQPKVIPFLNYDNFKFGELITFDVFPVEFEAPVIVKDNEKETGSGTIGIAVNVKREEIEKHKKRNIFIELLKKLFKR